MNIACLGQSWETTMFFFMLGIDSPRKTAVCLTFYLHPLSILPGHSHQWICESFAIFEDITNGSWVWFFQWISLNWWGPVCPKLDKCPEVVCSFCICKHYINNLFLLEDTQDLFFFPCLFVFFGGGGVTAGNLGEYGNKHSF